MAHNHNHNHDHNHDQSQDHSSDQHSHSHGCSHHHHHTDNASAKTLLISFVLISLFMLVEYWAGFTFNSLALMADAGHMLNDSFSLGLALLALTWLKRWQKPLAVVNGLSLIFIALGILWEAVERLQNPQEMVALPMMIVAALGLLINLIVAKIMLSADHDNANIRAAYLHVLADAAGSVVAILAGLSAYFLGWQWVDPLASAILSLLILKSGIGVTRFALKS